MDVPATGRGRATDVVGLSALYADLDGDPGKLEDIDTCWRIVRALEDVIGRPATAVVGSGHGLQPYWSVSGPGTVWDKGDDIARAYGASALKRFGDLVECVARIEMGGTRAEWDERHGSARPHVATGAAVDSHWVDRGVYELARVLRVPGTRNYKRPDQPAPVELLAIQPLAKPLTIADVLDLADKYVPKTDGREGRQGPGDRNHDAETDLHRFLEGLGRLGISPTTRIVLGYDEDTEYRSPCPVHSLDGGDHAEDSLSFGISTRELPRLVWHCFGGCEPGAVAKAVGLWPWSESAGDWPEPQRLASAPAPVDVSGCPPVFARMVTAVADMVEAPVEVALAFALAVLSAATRGCWSVRISQTWNAGPVAIYALVMASSGERKSPAVEPVLRALTESEERRRADVAGLNRRRAVEHKLAKKALAAAEKSEDVAGAVAAMARVEASLPLAEPRLIQSDATTEALGVHMSAQGGPVALMMTESTAYSTIAGAYSDAAPNVGLVNNAYDGEAYSDLRIRREGMRISHPFLAIGAAVQPEVMAGYADRGTEGSGFLGRHLLFVPQSKVGTRTFDGAAIAADDQAEWDRAVVALADVAWAHHLARITGAVTTHVMELNLDADAAAMVVTYAKRLEAMKVEGSEVRDLGGWAEKHPARIARIAGLFALLESPYSTAVGERHVQAALSLADATVDHALAGFRVLRNVSRRGPVSRVMTVLLGKSEVSTRDVHRAVGDQAWCATAEDVRRVLRDLADMGYVRPVPAEVGAKGGRPPERWAVHPWLATAKPGESLVEVMRRHRTA